MEALAEGRWYPQTISKAHYGLGKVETAQRHYQQARAHLVESLSHAQKLGHTYTWLVVNCCGMLGLLAQAQGQYERAARLCGAALALWDTLDAQGLMSSHWDADPELAAAYLSLDRAAFQHAWAEGQAMTLEQAIAYALEEACD